MPWLVGLLEDSSRIDSGVRGCALRVLVALLGHSPAMLRFLERPSAADGPSERPAASAAAAAAAAEPAAAPSLCRLALQSIERPQVD